MKICLNRRLGGLIIVPDFGQIVTDWAPTMASASVRQRTTSTPATSSSSPSLGTTTRVAPRRWASRTRRVRPDTARSSPARPTSPIAAKRARDREVQRPPTRRPARAPTSTPGSLAGSPPAVAAKTSRPLVSIAQRDSRTASRSDSRWEETWWATRRGDAGRGRHERLHLDEERARTVVGHREDDAGHVEVGSAQDRGVGHLAQSVGHHLEQTDLTGRRRSGV